jgi:hypothetical protein
MLTGDQGTQCNLAHATNAHTGAGEKGGQPQNSKTAYRNGIAESGLRSADAKGTTLDTARSHWPATLGSTAVDRHICEWEFMVLMDACKALTK